MGWILYFMRKCEGRENIPIWNRMLKQIAYRFGERLGLCTSRNIACIFHEFSILGWLPGRAVHSACKRVMERGLDKIDEKSLGLLLVAFARLGVYKADFWYPVADHLVKSGWVERAEMRSVATVKHAFGKARFRHKGLIDSLETKIGGTSKLNASDPVMI